MLNPRCAHAHYNSAAAGIPRKCKRCAFFVATACRIQTNSLRSNLSSRHAGNKKAKTQAPPVLLHPTAPKSLTGPSRQAAKDRPHRPPPLRGRAMGAGGGVRLNGNRTLNLESESIYLPYYFPRAFVAQFSNRAELT